MKVAGKYTDAELIAAIRDEQSLNKAILFIYQQYAASTSSFIIHYGGSEQDADDVFQETVVSFIEIVKKGNYRMEASIKTFLVSVAKNIWFNELKKRERSGHREKIFEYGRDQKEQDISHQIGDLEKKRQLRDLVNNLGEPCKKILMLFYYENLSMKELVEHLPYENEQVVRNKKYKCLQALTGFIKSNPAIAQQISEIVKS
ncbi:MAG TPA: sigma-70 family RNA polymerase sigma factor [Puia sp.]|jgi:RNA polymerase sigma factor (sigma-70 family)|nr:sigma-70 family RNA polymerase sigma factor [Puia sp.]